MKHHLSLTIFCLSFVILKGQDLKMNQTQVIGSHNSYKIGIEKPLMDMIVADRPEARTRAGGYERRGIAFHERLSLPWWKAIPHFARDDY